jgi:SulP family sulfate permease
MTKGAVSIAGDKPRAESRMKSFIRDTVAFYRDPVRIKNELLAGFTVAILKIPESVAFSLVAHVHPLQGLYGSFFMGVISDALGRPAMVSGCAGALMAVIRNQMTDDGPLGHLCMYDRREYALFTMFLCGMLQMVCGALQISRLVKMIPQPAFIGFFNGLAIIIGMSQMDTFKIEGAHASHHNEYEDTMQCEPVNFGGSHDKEWYTLAHPETWLMLVHIFFVAAVTEFLPKIKKTIKIGKIEFTPATLLPSALVGTLLSMAIEWYIFRPYAVATTLVGDVSPISGVPPPFHVPDVPWFDSEPWVACLPLAISLCFIGLVESVLTCRAVDELVDERSSTAMKNQVCMSQGLGNAVSSFFMAMGGCAMIGQSMINVNTGARGRMSSIVAGISVLAFVLVAYRFIEVIPLAALTGILFVVVVKTFKWSSVRDIVLRRIPIVDSITIILVTVLSVVQNLAIGVGVGILWQALAKSWTDAKHFEVEHKGDAIVVTGRIYFANCDDLIEAVGVVKGFSEVALDVSAASLLDYSATATLDELVAQYKTADITLNVVRESGDLPTPPAALPPRGLKPVAGSSQALMTDRTASSDDLTQLEMRDDLPAAGGAMSL